MTIYPFYLGKEIAKPLIKLLLESEQPIAVLPGRFQPFHRGHYEAYKYLVNKFGPDRVYIATSDKTEPGRSPFGFAEKQQIISKMFGIDPTHIVQTRSPYNPVEITQNLPLGTPVILGMGEKDASRMKGFQSEPGDVSQMAGYDPSSPTPTMYAMTVPMISGDEDVSGEQARQVFASGDENAIQALFQKMYGRDDPEMRAMVTGKVATSGQQAAAIAAEKQRKAAAPKANQFYRDRIKNPTTGNDLTVQSALASRDANVHQAARDYLKGKGVLIEEILLEDLLIKIQKSINPLSEKILLTCGGAFGHMAHPYEDMELSFGDLKELVKRSMGSGLGQEGPISEKVDGQNLMMTFIDGHVRFARNKGQLKNAGVAALTADGVRQMFAGRGAIEETFGNAAEDLETAIQRLPSEEQMAMFGGGTKFMNVEVIHPNSENVVPYGRNMLVLHQTMTYDANGDPISSDTEGGEVLAGALQKLNAEKQKEFTIRGRQPLTITSDGEGEKANEKAQAYIAELDEIKNQYGLTDDNTLGDYKRRAWSEILDDSRIPLAPEEKDALVRRWADGDKTFRIAKLPKEKQIWAKEVDDRVGRINGDFMSPVQLLIGRLAADTIARSTNLLASQNPKAAQQITAKLNDAVKVIKNSGDLNAQEKLDHFLKVVDTIGLEKLSPTEGIVFSFKGKLFKYTGLFAPMNRIINTVRLAKHDSPLANQPSTPSVGGAPPPAPVVPPPQPVAQPAAPVAPQKAEPDDALAGVRPEVLDRTMENPETKNQILVRTALKYPENHPAYIAARKLIGR